MSLRFARLVRSASASATPVAALLAAAALALIACGEVKSTDTTDAPPGIDAPANDAPDDGGVDAPIDGIPIDAAPGDLTVTIVRGGNAVGTITSDPAGIDCGTTCTASFAPGTLVTFTANPAAGASFAGWGGACSGALPSCSIIINAATAINANFTIARHTVSVSTTGTGRVLSTPSGLIDCPGTCTVTVDHGTMLALAATPGAGNTFAGWGGGCGGTNACSLIVTAPVQVSAAFAQGQTLVVTKSGNGTGTVAGTGINCGADCTETTAAGATVVLTATPSADSQFAGWSGACTNLTGTCTVVVNGATTVNAIFTLRQYTLTVNRIGSGTVTGTGISCGTDCTETYNAGASVVLQAVAASGNTFTGWSGACTGTATSCTVSMTAARTVTATFESTSPTVVLTLSVYGSGRLIANTAPQSGPATCTGSSQSTTTCQLVYPRNTTVGFQLSPLGETLAEIQGCIVSGSTCTTTLTSSQTIAAYFCGASCPI